MRLFIDTSLNRKVKKSMSIVTMVCMLLQTFSSSVYASGNGPVQSEIGNFTAIGDNQMVDPFTGDFKYNVSVLTVPGPGGGYPINLSYNSGIKMNQDASWVGLGWTLNPGAVTRDMRGIPDDFKGEDKFTKEVNLKTDWTLGLNMSLKGEFFGFDNADKFKKLLEKFADVKVGGDLGIRFNSYRGMEFSIGASLSDMQSTQFSKIAPLDNINLNFDSQGGFSGSAGFNFGKLIDGLPADFKTGVGFSSREGLYSTGVNVDGGENKTSVGFAKKALPPSIDMAKAGMNFNLGFAYGLAGLGQGAGGGITGFYKDIRLENELIDVPAFGYLYSEYRDDQKSASTNVDVAIMDYNKGANIMKNKFVPSLDAPVSTPDIFNVSAQGVGGSFRAYRNDVGVYYDGKVESVTHGAGINDIELQFAAGGKAGADGTYTDQSSYSGRWRSQVDKKPRVGVKNNNLAFKKKSGSFEPFYFKAQNEQSEFNSNQLDKLGGEQALAFDLTRISGDKGELTDVTGTLVKTQKGAAVVSDLSNTDNTSRDVRNTFFKMYTAEDYEYSHGRTIYGHTYKYGNPTILKKGIYKPADGKDHHIRAVDVYNSNGIKYNYGVPVYNKSETTVVFSVSGKVSGSSSESSDANSSSIAPPAVEKTATISGSKEKDNSSNEGGVDHYYERNTTPAYASSFLLTGIYSPEYVDLLNDGPSSDDLGSYTKFNYEQGEDFSWRSPHKKSGSTKYYNLNPGNLTNDGDDKLSYAYGEREQWYLKTIETKTHIAVFTIVNDRTDGKSIDGKKPGRLKKIDLYNLKEYKDAAGSVANLVPVKTVHFEYAGYSGLYSGETGLIDGSGVTGANCPDGKLTLKRIYTTFNGNDKLERNIYGFDYHSSENFSFDKTDIWGDYKETSGIDGYGSNAILPYTDQYQSKADHDADASLWNLSKITTPTGATISVEYEKDQYRYVQDRSAMYLAKVTGNTGKTSGNVFSKDDNKLYFELATPIPASKSLSEANAIVDDVVAAMRGKVYYKFYMKLKNGTGFSSGNNSARYEYLNGYAKLVKSGHSVVSNGTNQPYTHAYVTLEKADFNDMNLLKGTRKVHPIQKAGWQYIKNERSDLLYGDLPIGEDANNIDAGEVAEKVFNMLRSAGEALLGFYNFASVNKWCDRFVPNHSYIRVGVGNHEKFGGGHRVKTIKINDNWKTQTGYGENAIYGQVYKYELEDGSSSGVAQWEPALGGEDNPFREPIDYGFSMFFGKSNSLYKEVPIGEQYYPSPTVGYSRVLVRSIAPIDYGVSSEKVFKSSQGIKESLFYTAKDFPMVARRTPLIDNGLGVPNPDLVLASPKGKDDFKNPDKAEDEKEKKKKSKKGWQANISIDLNYQGYSQGFYFELNDMHGKLHSETVYKEDANTASLSDDIVFNDDLLYSTTVYEYKKDSEKTISSTVKDKEGNSFQMGKEHEFVVAMHQVEDETIEGMLEVNGEVPTFTLPFIYLRLGLGGSYAYNRIRTITNSKIVRKTGIVEKVISKVDNVTTVQEYTNYDRITGEPVITKTTKNSGLEVYDFSVKGYEHYESMAGKYLYEGKELTISSNSSGLISAPSFLKEGDHLRDASNDNYWVFKTVDDEGVEEYFLKDRSGAAKQVSSLKVEIVNSAFKNMMGVSIGGYSSVKEAFLKETFDINDVIGDNEALYSEINAVSSGSGSGVGSLHAKYAAELGTLINEQTLCKNVWVTPQCTQELIIGEYKTFEDNSTYEYEVDLRPGIGSKLNLCNSGPQSFSSGVDHLGAFTKVTMLNSIGFNYDYLIRCIDFDIVNVVPGYNGSSLISLTFLGTNYPESGLRRMVSFSSNYSCNNDDFDCTETQIKDDPVASTKCGGYRNVLNASASTFKDSYEYDVNSIGDPTTLTGEVLSVASTANPYLFKRDNIWRSESSYLFEEDRWQLRYYNGGVDSYKAEEEGEFKDFIPFRWNMELNDSKANEFPTSNQKSKWVNSNRVVQYDANSNVVESKNALGVTTSSIFGYGGVLQTGVAINAKHDEIGFDAFEDHGSTYNEAHGNIKFSGGVLSSEEYHTGVKSFKASDPASGIDIDLNTYLSLSANKKYLVSFWVKEGEDIEVTGSINEFDVVYHPNVINGWQRIEIGFTSASTNISNINVSASTDLYIDDVRILPYDASMKTSVFDWSLFLPVAELDDQNFAILNGYDQEGRLFNVKKETNKGIYTIRTMQSNIAQ